MLEGMAVKPSPRPALRGGPFTVADARRVGLRWDDLQTRISDAIESRPIRLDGPPAGCAVAAEGDCAARAGQLRVLGFHSGLASRPRGGLVRSHRGDHWT